MSKGRLLLVALAGFSTMAAGTVWAGEQLYGDPTETANTWTCGNLQCGGVCDPARMTRMDQYGEAAQHIRRTARDVGEAMVLGAFHKDWVDHEEDRP